MCSVCGCMCWCCLHRQGRIAASHEATPAVTCQSRLCHCYTSPSSCSGLLAQLLGHLCATGGKIHSLQSAFEKTLHCKALLLHYHGNGEESVKCWSQNLKVTQSIHVLIIPLCYERNITSLVSMMKIHIRSSQSVY